jgi:hypothetical protein
MVWEKGIEYLVDERWQLEKWRYWQLVGLMCTRWEWPWSRHTIMSGKLTWKELMCQVKWMDNDHWGDWVSESEICAGRCHHTEAGIMKFGVKEVFFKKAHEQVGIVWGHNFVNKESKYMKVFTFSYEIPLLVICPFSIMPQWCPMYSVFPMFTAEPITLQAFNKTSAFLPVALMSSPIGISNTWWVLFISSLKLVSCIILLAYFRARLNSSLPSW